MKYILLALIFVVPQVQAMRFSDYLSLVIDNRPEFSEIALQNRKVTLEYLNSMSEYDGNLSSSFGADYIARDTEFSDEQFGKFDGSLMYQDKTFFGMNWDASVSSGISESFDWNPESTLSVSMTQNLFVKDELIAYRINHQKAYSNREIERINLVYNRNKVLVSAVKKYIDVTLKEADVELLQLEFDQLLIEHNRLQKEVELGMATQLDLMEKLFSVNEKSHNLESNLISLNNAKSELCLEFRHKCRHLELDSTELQTLIDRSLDFPIAVWDGKAMVKKDEHQAALTSLALDEFELFRDFDMDFESRFTMDLNEDFKTQSQSYSFGINVTYSFPTVSDDIRELDFKLQKISQQDELRRMALTIRDKVLAIKKSLELGKNEISDNENSVRMASTFNRNALVKYDLGELTDFDVRRSAINLKRAQQILQKSKVRYFKLLLDLLLLEGGDSVEWLEKLSIS